MVIIIHKYLIISLYEQLQVNIILPVLYLLICAFLVVLPLSTTPRLVGVAMVIICAGIPVYIVCIYWKGKPRWIRKLTREYCYAISGINNRLRWNRRYVLFVQTHVNFILRNRLFLQIHSMLLYKESSWPCRKNDGHGNKPRNLSLSYIKACRAKRGNLQL